MHQQIEVQVKVQFLAEQSKPDDKQYVFAYTIRIHNTGDEAAQLISRHWIIHDEKGAKQEVQGLGVIGEQPRLEAGESYTYTSGVVLETPTGTMEGSYQMVRDTGDTFDAEIPVFALVQPQALH